MAGPVPPAIVLALGAGALGAPDALRLLLQSAGRSPAVDLAICLVVITVATAHLLGTILLVRFVRKARGGGAALGAGAPSTNLFAQVTAAVSVGAALLVTVCLVAVPGGLGSVRHPVHFAVKDLTVLVIGAAAAGCLPCTVPLALRFFRGAGGADGHAPAAPATASKSKTACLIALSLVAVLLHLLIPESSVLRPIVNTPVGVAIATVAGTTLLVWCSHTNRARNAAGAGGPVPVTYTRRCCMLLPLMSVAVVTLACLVAMAYSPPELE